MLLTSFAFLIYASAAALAQSQTPIVYNTAHNVTSISGTWSSGSGNVTTGPTYVFPANESFSYPTNTGMSYSFDEASGWFEVFRFRMNGNGSAPNCITTVVNWSHGLFSLLSNGSITFTPVGDGYQQIQNPCAATSNFIQNYNDTELYLSWTIWQDPILGPQLHLAQFDGSLLPPMNLLSSTPNMLPTQSLRNAPSPSTTVLKRSTTNFAPSPIHWWNVAALSTIGMVLGSVLLL